MQNMKFRERKSEDYQRSVQYSKEKQIALVFHKDPTSKFYFMHASKFNEHIKRVYFAEVQDTFDETRVYNIADYYTIAQQERA